MKCYLYFQVQNEVTGSTYFCNFVDFRSGQNDRKCHIYQSKNFTKLQLHDMVQCNHFAELLAIYQTQKKVKCHQHMKKQTLT